MARAHRSVTILDALADPALFAPAFAPEATWRAWRAALSAVFGLPMDETALALFRAATGRTEAPTRPAREAWFIAGRRGGKSRIAGFVAVYLACFRSYTEVLAPGERGTVMVVAADRKQAQVVLRYIRALIEQTPMLAALVERQTRDSIVLTNRVTIEVQTASWRTTRGYTVVAAILDEIAFWRGDDSANPDTEIINAIRPAMATVPGALLLAISSPYARRGALWDAFRSSYGHDGDVLVWKADTRTMNPAVDERVIADAYERDEAAARAEYGAEFRSDLEDYVSKEALDAVTIPGRRELPALDGVVYHAFVDPSGGSQDSMTLAIAHLDGEHAVLDCIREVKPPFSPEAVVTDFAATLAVYGCTVVAGDRYAGEWPREQFRKLGIEYVVAESSKSDIYRELLASLNSQRVALLDHPRLLAQFSSLERRTGRSGKDSIDHGPGGHDDVCNAASGALLLALGSCEAIDLEPTNEELAQMQAWSREFGAPVLDELPRYE